MIPCMSYWFYKYITGPTYKNGGDHWRMSETNLIKYVDKNDPRKVFYSLCVDPQTEECVLKSEKDNPWVIDPIEEHFQAKECLSRLMDYDLLDGWNHDNSVCAYTDEEIKKYEKKVCGQNQKFSLSSFSSL